MPTSRSPAPRIVVTVAVAGPPDRARPRPSDATRCTPRRSPDTAATPIVLDATSTRRRARRGVRDDGRAAHQRRRGPPSGALRADPAGGRRRWSSTVTRSRPRPGRRPRRGRCRCSGSAAGSRRSTPSPAARSSSTSTATRVRAGARARRSIHPLRVAPGTRLARILFPTNSGGGVVRVNSYHHQAVRPSDLAPGLVANAWASSPAGDLIEGLEAADGRFVFGLQCHPGADRVHPARLRAAVQRLRGRRPGAGRPALTRVPTRPTSSVGSLL